MDRNVGHEVLVAGDSNGGIGTLTGARGSFNLSGHAVENVTGGGKQNVGLELQRDGNNLLSGVRAKAHNVNSPRQSLSMSNVSSSSRKRGAIT